MKLEVNSKVLVPMDYSEFCANTINYALSLVPANKLEIIHVAQRPAVMSPGVMWDTISDPSIKKHCVESFDKFKKKYQLPGELQFEVKIGDPAEEIAMHAKNANVELILVSSHGRRGITRFFLGSVAERVARLAHCPVMVFKPDEIAKDRHEKLAELDAMTRSMFEAEYT